MPEVFDAARAFAAARAIVVAAKDDGMPAKQLLPLIAKENIALAALADSAISLVSNPSVQFDRI